MRTADKTTYQDLSSTSAAGVNALLDAKTQSRKADLQRRLNDAIRTFAPPIGQYWKGQGGIYAGIIRDGDHQWHLILGCTISNPQSIEATYAYSPDDCAITGPWGEHGVSIKGGFSRHDRQHNTQLILAAQPQNKIANYITSLEIDGHRDFYWPALYENSLLCINLPEHFAPQLHWSSTSHTSLSAWSQDFEDGGQDFNGKPITLAARAVRRIPIE